MSPSETPRRLDAWTRDGSASGNYAFGMPKRTTPFQAMVRMMREHYAQPGVTITESKFLRDAVTGIQREVDVVIEGTFDGEPMVISAEVIEHTRPATLTWVEQMLRKHRDLPTNRLLLVSKSGFSANGLSLTETEAGRVEALTPEIVEVDGSAVVKRLYVDNVTYNPTRCTVHVRCGGGRIAVQGEPQTVVFAADGAHLGPLSYLVQDAVNVEPVRHALFAEAHKHPEKDKIKAFSLASPCRSSDTTSSRWRPASSTLSKRWRYGAASRCTRPRSRSP